MKRGKYDFTPPHHINEGPECRLNFGALAIPPAGFAADHIDSPVAVADCQDSSEAPAFLVNFLNANAELIAVDLSAQIIESPFASPGNIGRPIASSCLSIGGSLSLGLESSGKRVVGVSNPQDGERPRILVRDFNQDGFGDILIGTTSYFSVFLMGPIDR